MKALLLLLPLAALIIYVKYLSDKVYLDDWKNEDEIPFEL